MKLKKLQKQKLAAEIRAINNRQRSIERFNDSLYPFIDAAGERIFDMLKSERAEQDADKVRVEVEEPVDLHQLLKRVDKFLKTVEDAEATFEKAFEEEPAEAA